MKSINSIHLAFFSGTGGTALVAETLENTLLLRNLKVLKTEINLSATFKTKADLLIILFPVYAFNAPKPVEEWLKQISVVHKSQAAVISVSGGGEISPNTACRVRIIKLLERKNYKVNYETMIVMPSNFVIGYDDIVSAMLIRAVPAKVLELTEDILSAKSFRKKPLVIDRIFSHLGLIERVFSGNMFGKRLRTTMHCTGCSWCSKHCPTNNISMKDRKPVFHNKCVICMRCVYGCPSKAIVPGFGKFMVLKNGYNLKELNVRTSHIKLFPPVKSTTKGILLSGVRKYLEKFYS